jgi:hypothetical protein
MSWICDLLSELKLLMTLFASEPHGAGRAIMISIMIMTTATAAAVSVGLDSLQEITSASIVQEKQALAQPPERSGAELVRTGSPLDDALVSPNPCGGERSQRKVCRRSQTCR